MEKGFLASQVQRYQFNPLFDPTQHNRMVPAILDGIVGVGVVPARLIRQESQGVGLFALFQGSEGKHWELSTSFIRTSDDLPSVSMAIDPSNGLQLCRSRDAAIGRCHRHFSEKGANEFEFAISSIVHGCVDPAPKDMVYLPDECTIAEVKAIDSSDGKMKVLHATELLDLPHRTSVQTFFRFQHDSHVSEVGLSDVIFPLDLSFNAREGYFTLRKTAQMETV